VAVRWRGGLVAAFGVAFVVVLLAGCAGATDWASPGPDTRESALVPAPMTAPAPAPPPVQIRDATLRATPAPAPAPPPVRLEVPDVGIDMPVDPVGVTETGDMAIPEDATHAGWYAFGPTPSDAAGSTVVAAHVDSRQTGIGPFAELRSVAVGSPVVVTTADGVAHRYVVSSVAKTPKADAPVPDWFDRTGAPRLVLVTCGGQWRSDLGHYADNVVVTASPTTG
jgi:Sortase domain